MKPIDAFMAVYREKLFEAHTANSNVYWWPIANIDQVCAKMRDALLNGCFNKDGPAAKATLKALGIKPTFKAIAAYIKGE